MDDQLKAQTAVLYSKQQAASDAQALILEQQEANIRDEWRHVSEEHTSAHEDHNEACRSAIEALDAELKSQIAAPNSNYDGASKAQAVWVEQQETKT